MREMKDGLKESLSTGFSINLKEAIKLSQGYLQLLQKTLKQDCVVTEKA